MKRIFIMLAATAFIVVLILFIIKATSKGVPNSNISQDSQKNPPAEINQNNQTLADNNVTAQNNKPVFPIDRAGERVTKKPFGIYITPQNSPVQPERFQGYHTGTDFETFPDEQDADVPVYAIISGKIVLEKWASGYGGVLVESGEINNNIVTIIYGHLNLSSISKKTGDSISAGEEIGVLGKGYSQQTDGERKHLHLGIHKGSSINILGYVQNKDELSQWLDPMTASQIKN